MRLGFPSSMVNESSMIGSKFYYFGLLPKLSILRCFTSTCKNRICLWTIRQRIITGQKAFTSHFLCLLPTKGFISPPLINHSILVNKAPCVLHSCLRKCNFFVTFVIELWLSASDFLLYFYNLPSTVAFDVRVSCWHTQEVVVFLSQCLEYVQQNCILKVL